VRLRFICDVVHWVVWNISFMLLVSQIVNMTEPQCYGTTGRVAMIGFAASLVGEYSQPGSRGPLGQVSSARRQ